MIKSWFIIYCTNFSLICLSQLALFNLMILQPEKQKTNILVKRWDKLIKKVFMICCSDLCQKHVHCHLVRSCFNYQLSKSFRSWQKKPVVLLFDWYIYLHFMNFCHMLIQVTLSCKGCITKITSKRLFSFMNLCTVTFSAKT